VNSLQQDPKYFLSLFLLLNRLHRFVWKVLWLLYTFTVLAGAWSYFSKDSAALLSWKNPTDFDIDKYIKTNRPTQLHPHTFDQVLPFSPPPITHIALRRRGCGWHPKQAKLTRILKH
jgi:hypothetical protein